MSYIGNTPTQQNFVAGADQFNGNGSTTAFTLSRNVNTVFDIFVAISNVPQDPYSAYSVSGNTLTFTSAPPSGTGNIYVVYRATNVQTFVPTQGVSPSFGNLTYTGTLTGSTGVVNIGSGQLYKDASGNVGIGTSSPTYQTQIYGTGQTTAALTDAGNKGGSLLLNTPTVSAGDGGALLIGAGGSGAKPFAAVKGLLSDGGGNTIGSLAFSTRNATGDTALTERARIDSSGNVGIGTSSPLSTAMLEVSRSTTVIPTATVTADNQVVGWRSRRTGGTYPREYYIGIRENSTALDFYDNTANALRARIESGGSFLVGTTNGDPIGAKVQGIALNGTGNQVNAMSDGQRCGAFGRYTSTGSLVDFFYYGGSLVGTGSISTNGTNTAYNTSSDYRLKHDIQPMQGALAKVAALKPVTYKWNVDDSDGEGFIAHELAEVCPGAVYGEKDAVNEDGSIKPQGIDTSFLVATLTAAIQELKAELDATKAEVAALKGAA